MSARRFDLMKDRKDERDCRFRTVVRGIKRKIDYTSEMSPVKDQGLFGACTGFAICGVKEWQEQKEHNQEVKAGKFDHRDNKYYDLSEQWIYWNAKKIDEWPNEEGTSIRDGLRVLKKIGVPVEKAWPYQGMTKGKPESWAKLVALWSLARRYNRLDNLSQIVYGLNKSPVILGFGTYEEIFDVSGNGIIPNPRRPEYCYGGHAVCVVGYDNDTGYLKFKNSWGTDWGKEGYGYLSYNYVINYMWDAWEVEDISVKKEMLKGKHSLT
jgi:C1A family cysteine protease